MAASRSMPCERRFRPARSRAPRRSARWRSSPTSSPISEACTPARWGTSASAGTSTWRSRCAPSSSPAATPTCRRVPGWSPIRSPSASSKRPWRRPAPCSRRSRWPRNCDGQRFLTKAGDHRQLRLVHVQPRPVPRRARLEPVVFRNDEVTVSELAGYDGIVISPGPGTPDDAGISNQAIKELSGKVAILGVCLGHQCLGQAFGARVVRNEPSHGKTSWIRQDNSGVMAGVADPFEATRYHSLIVERTSLPPELVVTAWTTDGTVMGLRHTRHPTYGVQFHPESVLTKEGKKILGNFIRRASH